jgi:hypothetical protein
MSNAICFISSSLIGCSMMAFSSSGSSPRGWWWRKEVIVELFRLSRRCVKRRIVALKASERTVVQIVVCNKSLEDGDGLVSQGIVKLDLVEKWRHGLGDASEGRAELGGTLEMKMLRIEGRSKMGGCRREAFSGRRARILLSKLRPILFAPRRRCSRRLSAPAPAELTETESAQPMNLRSRPKSASLLTG